MAELSINNRDTESGKQQIEFHIDGKKKAEFSLDVDNSMEDVTEQIQRALQGLPKELKMSTKDVLSIVNIIFSGFSERVEILPTDTELRLTYENQRLQIQRGDQPYFIHFLLGSLEADKNVKKDVKHKIKCFLARPYYPNYTGIVEDSPSLVGSYFLYEKFTFNGIDMTYGTSNYLENTSKIPHSDKERVIQYIAGNSFLSLEESEILYKYIIYPFGNYILEKIRA